MLAATRIPRALAALAEGPTALYAGRRRPARVIGMVCAGLKTVAADLTVQTVVEKKQLHEVDKDEPLPSHQRGLPRGSSTGLNKVLPAMWPRASNCDEELPRQGQQHEGLLSLVGLPRPNNSFTRPLFLPCFYMTKESSKATVTSMPLHKVAHKHHPACARHGDLGAVEPVNFAFVPSTSGAVRGADVVRLTMVLSFSAAPEARGRRRGLCGRPRAGCPAVAAVALRRPCRRRSPKRPLQRAAALVRTKVPSMPESIRGQSASVFKAMKARATTAEQGFPVCRASGSPKYTAIEGALPSKCTHINSSPVFIHHRRNRSRRPAPEGGEEFY